MWDSDLGSMVAIGLHVCRRLGSVAIAEAQHVDQHDRAVFVGRRVGYVCPVHWIAVARQSWCFEWEAPGHDCLGHSGLFVDVLFLEVLPLLHLDERPPGWVADNAYPVPSWYVA